MVHEQLSGTHATHSVHFIQSKGGLGFCSNRGRPAGYVLHSFSEHTQHNRGLKHFCNKRLKRDSLPIQKSSMAPYTWYYTTRSGTTYRSEILTRSPRPRVGQTSTSFVNKRTCFSLCSCVRCMRVREALQPFVPKSQALGELLRSKNKGNNNPGVAPGPQFTAQARFSLRRSAETKVQVWLLHCRPWLLSPEADTLRRGLGDSFTGHKKEKTLSFAAQMWGTHSIGDLGQGWSPWPTLDPSLTPPKHNSSLRLFVTTD